MLFHGRNQYVVSNSQGEPVWSANGVHHHRSCLQLSRIFVFAGEKDLTAWREFERALSAHVKGRGAGFSRTHSVARKNRDVGGTRGVIHICITQPWLGAQKLSLSFLRYYLGG